MTRNRNVLHIDNGNKPGYTHCGRRSSPVNARPLQAYLSDPENSFWCKSCVRAISAGPKPAYLVRKPLEIRQMARRSLGLQERFSSIAQSVRYRPPRTRRYGLRRPIAARIVDGRFLDATGWVLDPSGKRDEEFKMPCPSNTTRIIVGAFLDAGGYVLTASGDRDGRFELPCPPNTARFVDVDGGIFLDAEGRRLKRDEKREEPFGREQSVGSKRANSMGRRRRGGF